MDSGREYWDQKSNFRLRMLRRKWEFSYSATPVTPELLQLLSRLSPWLDLLSTLLRTVLPGCFDGRLDLAGAQTIQRAMASQTFETSKEENDRFPFAFKSEFSQAVSNSEHDASMFSRKLPDRINPLTGLVSDADDLTVSPPSINDRGVSQSH
jgi:hypothetical protein